MKNNSCWTTSGICEKKVGRNEVARETGGNVKKMMCWRFLGRLYEVKDNGAGGSLMQQREDHKLSSRPTVDIVQEYLT